LFCVRNGTRVFGMAVGHLESGDIQLILCGLLAHGEVLILIFLVVLLLALLYMMRRSRRMATRLRKQEQVFDLLLNSGQSNTTFDQTASAVLAACVRLAPADVLSLYKQKGQSDEYQLVAVRYRERQEGKIRPSYSGLSPYLQEVISPAQMVLFKREAEMWVIQKEGNTEWLAIALEDSGWLLRLAPRDSVRKSDLRALAQHTGRIARLLDGARMQSDQRAEAERSVTLGHALQKAYDIVQFPDVGLQWFLDTSAICLQASGGAILQLDEGNWKLHLPQKISSPWQQQLQTDSESMAWLVRKMSKGWLTINQTDEIYYQLPVYFSLAGMQALTLIALNAKCVALYVFTGATGDLAQKMATLQQQRQRLQLLHATMATLLSSVGGARDMAPRLEQFTLVLDLLKPSLVGYSDLCARYAVVVARQLKLSPQEIDEVALAAKFSQVGLLGLPWDLMENPHRYTESDYQLMKLHTDIGGALVVWATGNERIGALLRFHHERPDGYGYPDGLRDAAIPLGSSIVATVQFYLAKMMGRPNRAPLTYRQAITMLEAAAGTQLSVRVVEAFVEWLNERHHFPDAGKRMLAPCYSLCAAPPDICASCPALRQQDSLCFEVEGTQCHQHGRECMSCMVRSEWLERATVKRVTVL